ncbi:MAG: DUF4159 domain-containing protein [Calditrichaeota bacterium]|nr:MAG: DUF4159 domain-containing protein [Calditrichota bacterium]MBL1205968.1 DUF4159 domain-containing protein [Calditrichota bacterium]NOG45796.1 DUF4159 domain-containing protein [Calditrichota bacterium]
MKQLLTLSIIFINIICAQEIAPVRIHYSGGGDWYGNKTSWKNILYKADRELNLSVKENEVAYKILEPEFSSSPIAYISGHGNISFSLDEAAALRSYLISGGFLFADDDYGMDKSFRKQMKKVFPELNFVELPFSHPIYHSVYNFNNGLPKIHEHDGGPAKGFGLIYEGRLVCFYSFNTDISDGCEDEPIHNDPPKVREQALKMALNILVYALLN